MIWLVLVGFWLLFFQPFGYGAILGPLSAMQVFVPSLIVLWFISWLWNSDSKRPLENIFTLAILSYTLAITISTWLSPHVNFGDYVFRTWLGFTVLFVILITSAKTEKKLKTVVTGLSVILFVHMSFSYWAFLGGNVRFSQGTERLQGIGGGGTEMNYYSTMQVCALPLLLPLVTLCKRYWHYLFIMGYFLLTIRIVTLSGSRTAFIMFVTLAIVPIIFSQYRFRVLPVVFLMLPAGWFFMPEQYHDRFRTIWDPTIRSDATASRDSRLSHLFEAMDVWADNPVFGTGPGSSQFVTSHGVAFHNLPGQVVSEMGTVGIITFLLLLSCFGINHYNIWRNYKYLQEKKLDKEGLYCWRVSLAVLCGVAMLLLQGGGLANAQHYLWIWFGAFQALATILLQEKVTAIMQGKLLPSLPGIPARK